ncbi:MAG: TIGR03087 family PEP-CTERM/XrtA system glycosyltransferase [Novosphingobium sp.]|nr:TIGR03087 family PEP-CTERM/XrtA system glycosyltransferase [Novosphingobium sp.]
MGEILFLAHRIPFPPDRGDKIRSHHVLRGLAALAPVHVATFADDSHDLAQEAELAAVARSYCLIRRRKHEAVAGVQALLGGRPVSLDAFHHRALARYVETLLKTRPISAIYVFSGQMGQYVPHDFAGRVIADFVDVDSAKFDAYAEAGKGPMALVYRREGRLLRAEEARLAGRADVSVLISEREADLFRARLPEAVRLSARVAVMANGMDAASFDPARVAPEPKMLACSGPRLIFTGQMDYAPNAEAALRVIERILPCLRRTVPGATFHVVGRNPVAALLAHDGKNGVYVWGRVDDIRPWLRAADGAVVPLSIARGVQNKVLEAMAMALPVVLTSRAAIGIDAVDCTHFNVADDDDAIVAALVALAADKAAAATAGQAARRWIVERASWRAALSALPALVGMGEGPVRDAA